MLVFTDKDTQTYFDVIKCWVKDSCLFIEDERFVGNKNISMIPLCNIRSVSGISIDQWYNESK